jgi:hypothetical protein
MHSIILTSLSLSDKVRCKADLSAVVMRGGGGINVPLCSFGSDANNDGAGSRGTPTHTHTQLLSVTFIKIQFLRFTTDNFLFFNLSIVIEDCCGCCCCCSIV